MKNCRLCFDLDGRMCNLTDEKIRTFMGLIFKACGYQHELLEKHYVCFECKALLIRTYKFIQKTLRAQELLKEIQTQKSVQLKTYNGLRDKYHLNSSLSHHKVKVDFTFKVTDPCTHSDTDSSTDSCPEQSKFGAKALKPKIEVEVNSLKQDKKLLYENVHPIAEQAEEKLLPIKVETEDNFEESEFICQTGENFENPEEYGDPLVVPKNECDTISNANQDWGSYNQIENNFVGKNDLDPKENYVGNTESDPKIIDKSIIAEDSNSVEWKPGNTKKKPKKKKKPLRRPCRSYVIHNSSSEGEAKTKPVVNKRKVRTKPQGVIISTDNILSSSTRRKNINFTKLIGPDDSDEEKRVKKQNDSDCEYNPNFEQSQSESSEDGEDSFDESGKRIKKKIQYPRYCCHCDMEMETAKDYFYHHLSFHPNEKYEFACKKKFVCQHCGVSKSRYHHLVEHESTHGKPTVQCPDCPRKFHIKKKLTAHIRNVHAPRTLFCDYCNKAFPTKSDLKLHIRIHTGEKPFNCHICGMGFAHLGNVSIHIRSRHMHEPSTSKQANSSRKARKRRWSPDPGETTDTEPPPILNKTKRASKEISDGEGKRKKKKHGKNINKKKRTTEKKSDTEVDVPIDEDSNFTKKMIEQKSDNEDDVTTEQKSDSYDKPLNLRRNKKVTNGKEKKKGKNIKKMKGKSTEQKSDSEEGAKEKSTCKESTTAKKSGKEELNREKTSTQNDECKMPEPGYEEEWLTYFQL